MVSQEQLRDSLVVSDQPLVVLLKSFLEYWAFSSHCIKKNEHVIPVNRQ